MAADAASAPNSDPDIEFESGSQSPSESDYESDSEESMMDYENSQLAYSTYDDVRPKSHIQPVTSHDCAACVHDRPVLP